ncbi:MAG: hypothetical protein HYU67_12525 [Flavobacteriia bacterium]|nr:hypothetical protein [Flavobacteriia bacterium]
MQHTKKGHFYSYFLKLIFISTIVLFSSELGLSQIKYTLSFSDFSYKTVKKNPDLKFKDSLSLIKYIKDFRYFAMKKGYLLASIDSVSFENKHANCSFYVGEQFKKAKLIIEEDQMRFLKKKGKYREKEIQNIVFRPNDISNLMEDIINLYENNGYPFVKAYFEKIDIQNSVLYANLRIDVGIKLKIKKIHFPGDSHISEKFLLSYLQLKEGDFFNQKKIRKIPDLIKQISFLEEIKPSELLFTKEGVEIFIYLKSKPVSLINGVIGLQPNNNISLINKNNSKRYFLTGEVRLKLLNSLKMAELIDLQWRSLQAQTQNMKIQTTFPNLFRTPFGIDLQFQLYKRDTTFLELKLSGGINYTLNDGSILKVLYKRYSSSVLKAGHNNTSFSNLSNVESHLYGIGYSRQQLDYLPNPKKGFVFQIEASAGQRTTKDTNFIKKQTTAKFDLNVQEYFPVSKRFILKISNNTEVYIAPNYFENEIYRFGGQNSFRGFNEEELFATSRSVFSLEPRFLLDKNSFVFLFYDQAWYENKAKTFIHDTPFGFGAGFTFGTNLGNFAISYALGSQFNQAIQLKDGKVHFGYISYF